jgi:hypothetical protein
MMKQLVVLNGGHGVMEGLTTSMNKLQVGFFETRLDLLGLERLKY